MNFLISFLWLCIELAIVGFIGWIMVALLGLFPFIPPPIKAILQQVIYFIVAIVCAIMLIGWLLSLLGSGGPTFGHPTWPVFR